MTQANRPITADDLNRIHSLQDPQISPDGQYVAFVKIRPDPLNRTYKRNIWLLPTHDGDAFQLTRGNTDSGPRWSPDATQLAFTSGRGEKPQIYLLPIAAPGGEARALTDMENGAHSPDWSPDGRQIAFLSPLTAGERAAEAAAAAPLPEPKDKLERKQRKERKAEDELNRWDPRPVWRIPYRQGTSYVDERYDQVYVISTAETDDSKPRRLTNLNASYSQPRWSADGDSIYSDRTTTPQGDEPWRAKNIFRLDAESGEETALTDGEYSADENRMAITGGSYGGYMTAWIISHTNRFKAAVAQRGVYNISSFYGASDVPLLMSNEFDAEPWANHDVYWDNSPLKYAADIKTPLLLIHSEYDFRVPIEQAEQLFAWVRRATDTPVHMLRYPREGHELSRSGEPGHRVSRLTEMINWFDRYV